MKNHKAMLLSIACIVAPGVAASDFSFSPPPAGKMLIGEFSQADAAGHRTTGKFWFAGQAGARWEQDKPYEMLLVSTGSYVWQVEPDLNQAMFREIPEGDLFSALQRADLQSVPGTRGVFSGELEDLGVIEVHMTPGSSMPQMVIQRREGLTTRFSGVRTAPANPSLFRYTPPRGMDVVK